MRDTIRGMTDDLCGIARPLYDRVERERALKGWSSTRLHAETGVSRSTIGKWRTQKHPPLPGTVNAVADALGIPREEALRLAGILTDTAASDDRPPIVREHWDDEGVRKIWELRTIPPDAKAGLIGSYLTRRAEAVS